MPISKYGLFYTAVNNCILNLSFVSNQYRKEKLYLLRRRGNNLFILNITRKVLSDVRNT